MKAIALFVALMALVLGSGPAHASTEPAKTEGAIVGVPWTGARGVTRTVAEIRARERESANAPDAQPAPGANFLAAFLPSKPNTSGDVGPTQVVVAVNYRVKVLDKTGAPGALDVSPLTFWEAVRDEGGYVTDPRVHFDKLSGRWFLTMESVPPVHAPWTMMLAVSDGPEIVESTRFTFFRFRFDEPGPQPNADTNGFGDFNTLGVDKNAVYLGLVSVYQPAQFGATLFVIRKSSVLGDGPIVVTPFRRITTETDGGIEFAAAASNDDPNAEEGYFVGTDFTRFGVLNVRRVSDPGGTPRLSPDMPVAVPPTSLPPTILTAGGNSIKFPNDRLSPAQIFLDRLTGERTLWAAQAIGVDGQGVAPGGRAAVRWYQIGGLSSTPSLLQSGTVFDTSASPTERGFTIPSVAMSEQGHAVVGFTSAGAREFASIAVSRHLASDPGGSSGPVEVVFASATPYRGADEGWGDFSTTVVDPADGMTIWTFQQYVLDSRPGAIRVVAIPAPPPADPVSATPATVGVGTTATVAIEGASTNGAGFFDGGDGYAKRLAVTIDGTGVALAAARFVDPTHVALDLSVAADAPMGPRDVTITNPDGQSVTAHGLVAVGPAVASVKVKAGGGGIITLKGRGFDAGATILVDGVGFAGPPKVTGGKKVVQRGALSNGATIAEAIRPGESVTITVTNASGGVAVVPYTRPGG